jgi:hypothetical protein
VHEKAVPPGHFRRAAGRGGAGSPICEIMRRCLRRTHGHEHLAWRRGGRRQLRPVAEDVIERDVHRTGNVTGVVLALRAHVDDLRRVLRLGMEGNGDMGRGPIGVTRGLLYATSLRAGAAVSIGGRDPQLCTAV